jgi:cell division protease FtsH
VFLGHSVTQHKNVSDETAHAIDAEIRAIIDRNYSRAETILKEHMEQLHLMAEALIKYETIDSDQIDDIMAGRAPRPPAGWDEPDSGAKTGTPAGKPDQGGKGETKIGGPASQH